MATTRNKVMWQEGMLMRPHHFQQQQRYNDYLDNQRFRAMNDLSWGFTELTLNNELLAQGKIMIDSASGTLPDGTVFSIPDQDALPDPLHPQNFPDERSRNIYLALPVASDVRNEISDGRRIGRYRLNYADVRDLHSEEGDARTLTLGQLTPRIMSGAEDMSAYITLPLCRISNRHADGSLTLDDDFIPSCQNIQVSKKLRVYLKEVQGAIGGRASDLANRIGSPAQSGIADVAEFMMLQLLNRNQTRFTHRARRSQLHPEDFYLDLAGLLGELMTFTEPSRLPCPLDVYDHHDLTKTFKTLLPEVKRALHTVLSPRAVNLPLHLRDGIWQADIHDTELLQSATLCAGRGGKRAGRSDPASVYPAVENFLAGKNPQYGQCADPRYSIACPYGGSPPASLPFRVQLFRTRQEWPGLDRNGCRRGRCTACFRQFPGSEHATVGDKRVRRWMRGHCLCHHLPDTTKKASATTISRFVATA